MRSSEARNNSPASSVVGLHRGGRHGRHRPRNCAADRRRVRAAARASDRMACVARRLAISQTDDQIGNLRGVSCACLERSIDRRAARVPRDRVRVVGRLRGRRSLAADARLSARGRRLRRRRQACTREDHHRRVAHDHRQQPARRRDRAFDCRGGRAAACGIPVLCGRSPFPGKRCLI